MKPIAPICLILAVLLAGCETNRVTTRIQEKAAVFAALAPEHQQSIREGVIEVGFTPDMVYMALGKPSKVATKQGADGPVEMWTYRNYYVSGQMATSVVASEQQQFRANRDPGSLTGTMASSPYNPTASATKGGLQTNLHVPEPVSDTLYVFFFAGQVFQMKLESMGH